MEVILSRRDNFWHATLLDYSGVGETIPTALIDLAVDLSAAADDHMAKILKDPDQCEKIYMGLRKQVKKGSK